MNWQMEFLQNLIDSAKLENVDAIDLLRDVMKRAAADAPPDVLIRVAELLRELRMDEAKRHIEGN